MTLLAKSDGRGGGRETLLAHSLSVVEKAESLVRRAAFDAETGARVTRDLLVAAAAHDLGKAATGFQAVLAGTAADWERRRHETLSAAFLALIPEVGEEAILAVLTHHKKIPSTRQEKGELQLVRGVPPGWRGMIGEWMENKGEALAIWNRLCERIGRLDLQRPDVSELGGVGLDEGWLLDSVVDGQAQSVAYDRRYYAALLRGLLVSADHLASAHAELPPSVKLDEWRPSHAPRRFQQRAGAVSGNLILRAPTGSGKTESAILWARANQKPNGRLLYVLPFTAAINAMHLRLRREFPAWVDSIGVLHGRAAHHLYRLMSEDERGNASALQAQASSKASLAREMYHTVRVCTPHQILRYSLRGRGWETMLSEMTGACIVFDEVHAYEPRLAGLTLGTARLLQRVFGTRLMFLSATLPAFLQQEIEQAIGGTFLSPDPDEPSDAEVLGRKRHRLTLRDGNLEDVLEEIADAAVNGETVLVVCNHVRTAQSVWLRLKEAVGNRIPTESVVLFHSRFNQRDRRRKETMLSPGPDGKTALPAILVATQVVEVSLDISFDRGYTEPAPIDALAQRLGRVNRTGNQPKPVFVMRRQVSRHGLYPSEVVATTLSLLAQLNPELSEQDLTSVCDGAYAAGYTGKDREEFEQGFHHPLLENFEQTLVAGSHKDWTDELFRDSVGIQVLPACLEMEYRTCRAAKRWLDADSLMVDVRFRQVEKQLTRSEELDAYVVHYPYDPELGLCIEEIIA